ncbi:MAG TPA: glycerol-3-phosphate acyltransferase [Acidimicrobiales bacterium]|nr:glycerol-3-phosphate acyltransferase [Acidimicrobiales bacterium]
MTRPRAWWRSPPLVLAAGYAAGGVPFSNVAARLTRGVDLRHVGTGTVSGTALYRVAGFPPLAAAGICDVAKGSVGPLLAGRHRPSLAAISGGLAVLGHDWSPFLRAAGGRGVSPAMGALLPYQPAGAAFLLAGLTLGRLAGESAVGVLVADLAMVPFLSRFGGRRGRLAGAAVVVPMLLKRLSGNARPVSPGAGVYLWRLLLDRDRLSRGTPR